MKGGIRRIVPWIVLGTALCTVVLWGCATPQERYRVLSLFFDGVPDPDAKRASDIEREKQRLKKKATVESKDSKHEPYLKRQCDKCHSKSERQLASTENPFCYDCHKRTDFAPVLNHDPAVNGKCLSCHNPHFSSYPSLLKQSSDVLCFECHDKKTPEYSERHKAVAGREACETCHDPHGSKRVAFLKGGPEVCLKCHSIALKVKSVHDPVEAGKCGGCHEGHESKRSHNLRAEGIKLCFSCHRSELFTPKKKIHAPVENGECNECHEPHSSPNAALLKQPTQTLCFNCHDAQEKGYYNRHKDIGLEYSCEQCHDPHGGDQDAFIKIGGDSCGICHPLDDDAKFIHKPVNDGKCDGCHDPHGSGRPYNLKDTGDEPVCFQCHSKADLAESLDHAPAASGECNACHSTHASKYPSLLNDSSAQLCLGCHDKEEKTFRRQHKPLPSLVACESCHNPHGGKKPAFLIPSTEICQRCHPELADPKLHRLRVSGECRKCHPKHNAAKR